MRNTSTNEDGRFRYQDQVTSYFPLDLTMGRLPSKICVESARSEHLFRAGNSACKINLRTLSDVLE